MKKFVVDLDAKVWATSEVEVEAESAEEAEKIVRRRLEEEGVYGFQWVSSGDVRIDPEAIDIEEEISLDVNESGGAT